jgi:hypothetical protein
MQVIVLGVTTQAMENEERGPDFTHRPLWKLRLDDGQPFAQSGKLRLADNTLGA